MRAKNIAAPVVLFTPFLSHFSLIQRRLVSAAVSLPAQSVAFERTAPSSDIEMYLAKKKRISTWHGQPFCRRPPSRHPTRANLPCAELSAPAAYNVEKRMTAVATDWKWMKIYGAPAAIRLDIVFARKLLPFAILNVITAFVSQRIAYATLFAWRWSMMDCQRLQSCGE